jgi:DNA-binding NarL/FixJ family response regulator
MPHHRRATDPPRAPLGVDPARRRLTDRERAVALLVAGGLPVAAIAARLGLAPGTVSNYTQHILRKLDLDSRRELAAWVNARRDSADPEARLRRTRAPAEG